MNAINPNFDSSASPIALAMAITANMPEGWSVIEGGAVEPVEIDSASYDGDVDGMGNPLDGGPLVEPVEIEAEPEAVQEAPAPSCYGEFVIGRASIGKIMAALVRVVEKRNTIPVLGNVLLHASGGILTATATDLDCEIAAMVECGPGEFIATVDAHMLDSIFKKASASDEVGFRADATGDNVTVYWGKLSYSLPTITPADFPYMSARDLSHGFTLPGETFRGMMESAARAVSKEETRYYLNGVYLHSPESYGGGNRRELRAVATDGHRLYRTDIDMPEGADGMPGAIVPSKAVALLLALTKGKACPADIGVNVGEKHIRLSFGDLQLTSKLIDGTFPDYQRVIPTGNDRVATFDSGAFVEAMESVSLIASCNSRAVKFDLADGEIGLRVTNPDGERAQTSIAGTFMKAGEPADPLEIGFNTGYLATMMKDLADDGGEIVAAFGDAGSPALFRSGRENFLAVLMPMRV